MTYSAKCLAQDRHERRIYFKVRSTGVVFGLILLISTVTGQGIYVPPDIWGDTEVNSHGFRQNIGQVIDTDGYPVNQIGYYAESSPIGIYLRSKSQVSFTFSSIPSDTTSSDTLYRVDMEMSGGRERSPSHVGGPIGGRANYYRNGNTTLGAYAYGRTYYHSVWDSIDVHYYHASSGPRLAFVLRPGADPSEIKLLFTGQDSIRVSWEGALRMYLNERWIKLEEAVAYQIDANEDILPVNWTAGYSHQQGTAYVGFTFDTYNPTLPLVLQIGFPPIPLGGGGPNNNLTWSTTTGNDNIGVSTYGDFIFSGAALPDGDLIVSGTTNDDTYPANPGMTPTIILWDVFVSRYDYDPGDEDHDAELLWTTFYGGQGHDWPQVIHYSVDHSRIYVAGWTNSSDIPVFPPIDPQDGSYYQNSMKGQSDGLIIRLTEDGLIDRAGPFGGNGRESVTAVTESAFGEVFFFGVTTTQTGQSSSCGAVATGLPLCDPQVNNYQQNSNAGGEDGFVARFSDAFELTWCSFIGGSADDRIYDAAYLDAVSPTSDKLAIVGSTSGSMPYSNQAGFYLNGNGDDNGFLFLFNSTGRELYGTNLHGIEKLQAVDLTKDDIIVMGTVLLDGGLPTITNSCDEAANSLSICDPGGAAYVDDTHSFVDAYIAAFDIPTGDMVWSTLFGGSTDESAAVAAFRYLSLATQEFEMYRFQDIQVDEDDNFFVMGIVGQGDVEYPAAHDIMDMWGMYSKPFDPTMGNEQSEVMLALFRSDKALEWTSMFGAQFEHIVSTPPNFEDWDKLHLGCDFGHNLVFVEGEALYLVGSSGGINYDRNCPFPFPGPSYCELIEPVLNPFLSPMDGMIARFDLREIGVGIGESNDGNIQVLEAFPVPSIDILWLRIPSELKGTVWIQIIDATGRLVRSQMYDRNAGVAVENLASGSYSVRTRFAETDLTLSARFVKQ